MTVEQRLEQLEKRLTAALTLMAVAMCAVGDGGGDGRQGRPLPYGVCYLSNSKKYLREER